MRSSLRRYSNVMPQHLYSSGVAFIYFFCQDLVLMIKEVGHSVKPSLQYIPKILREVKSWTCLLFQNLIPMNPGSVIQKHACIIREENIYWWKRPVIQYLQVEGWPKSFWHMLNAVLTCGGNPTSFAEFKSIFFKSYLFFPLPDSSLCIWFFSHVNIWFEY